MELLSWYFLTPNVQFVTRLKIWIRQIQRLFEAKLFWNLYQDFLFKTKKFKTDSDAINLEATATLVWNSYQPIDRLTWVKCRATSLANENVLKPGSLETEKSHSALFS